MFAQTVEWHHTPLNNCSSALPARHNWQLNPDAVADFLKLDDKVKRKRGAAGYNNNNIIWEKPYVK